MEQDIADIERLIRHVEARRSVLAAHGGGTDNAEAVLSKLRQGLAEARRYRLSTSHSSTTQASYRSRGYA